jgi:hypothetical protein
MAIKPVAVHKMIHAKDNGNPNIKGVAEEKSVYPGQIRKIVIRNITAEKRIRDLTFMLLFVGGICCIG